MSPPNDWGQDQLDRLNRPQIANVIKRNVETLFRDRQKSVRSRTCQQHIADWVTRFAGSMLFVYLHATWFVIWFVAHEVLPDFDPGFADLTMIVSLEAIFLTVFVLVSQNRQGELADRRADLDLHITLLDEYETTRILTLVTALAEKAGIDVADPEFAELRTDVQPERILEEIERANAKGSS